MPRKMTNDQTCKFCGKKLGRDSIDFHPRCVIGHPPKKIKPDIHKIHAGTHGLVNGRIVY